MTMKRINTMYTQHILSIQSHVAFGYVGNRAAVFPLQRMGFDVSAINTVQFSNHTGYGSWTGDIFTGEHIQSIIDGMTERNAFKKTSALLSGYMGDADLGTVIVKTAKQLKSQNSRLIYCCDPVIGDVGRGVFVKPQVAEFIKEEAVDAADILTPNQFELEYLTDEKILHLDDVLRACEKIRERGPRTVLVTSLCREETAPDMIEMLLDQEHGSWLVRTPKLKINPEPNGAGDATAAIFLANVLMRRAPAESLAHVAGAIFSIFEETYQAQSRELQLIRAQNAFIQPPHRFTIEPIRETQAAII